MSVQRPGAGYERVHNSPVANEILHKARSHRPGGPTGAADTDASLSDAAYDLAVSAREANRLASNSNIIALIAVAMAMIAVALSVFAIQFGAS